MANDAPRLRAVGPADAPRPRRPGPAVLLILLYAALFGGALWYLRAKSPLFQRARSGDPAKPIASSALSSPRPPATASYSAKHASPPLHQPSRDALLSGEGLPEAGRGTYFRRLAIERCDCGCGRTLSDCLANEKSCSHSPALADRVRETVNGRR